MPPFIRNAIFALLRPVLIAKGRRGAVYITFDDGPHPDYTPAILAALAAHNAKATFFLIGSEIEKYPALVQRIVAEGHAVGYHSYSHRRLSEMTRTEVMADIARMDALQTPGAAGKGITLFRPPFGTLTLGGLLWYFVRRKKIVMWSLDSRDAFAADPPAILAKVNGDTVKDGDIILFHDDTAVTVAALPQVLSALAQKHFRFAALPA